MMTFESLQYSGYLDALSDHQSCCKTQQAEVQDAMFCKLDDYRADVARDALQSFALLACPDAKDGAGICKIIRTSKAMERLLEYDGVERKMPGMIGQVFGSATSQSTLKKLEVAVKKSLSFCEEMVCITAGEEMFWSDVSLEPVQVDASDSANSVVCFALFIRDIDEVTNPHSRCEHDAEFLQDLECDYELQRLAVDSALLNTTTTIQPVGESFDTTLSGLGIRPSADKDSLEKALQDGEPLSCDIMCNKSDGTSWWRHILAVPMAGGGFLLFSVDTTVKAKFVGQYQLGVTFGSGSFGTVKAGQHSVTKRLVAIKRMKVTKKSKHLIEREIKIQRQLKSSVVAELIEVHREKDYIFLIMELCSGGSLFDSVVSNGTVSEEKGRHFTSVSASMLSTTATPKASSTRI